ncbi:LysR family transcriptional regulator [Zhouia sp. PK063]|uniref:LysR family transcriptional regulator n=1 Tax=Zhouia sp. PK063 TaxID=3373602 RepID=UPI003794CAFB
MFDFRLKVFHTVAKRLNFTRAAQELFISQPAVTKHIKEIEQHYKVKLFDRNGTKITLTKAGETLWKYTEEVFEVYRKLEIELYAATNTHAGHLRIGASTTIANYVLPLVLPEFRKAFPEITVHLNIDNTEQIEKSLMNKEIDLGITEGFSKSSVLKYTEFLKDEIVLVGAAHHPLAKHSAITMQELKEVPVLLREHGSGTLDVISHALEAQKYRLADLKVGMQLSSSESMKLYLMNSDCLAFLSIYSILRELQQHTMSIIDVKDLEIERYFYFIQAHGAADALVDLFMEFAMRHNYR